MSMVMSANTYRSPCTRKAVTHCDADMHADTVPHAKCLMRSPWSTRGCAPNNFFRVLASNFRLVTSRSRQPPLVRSLSHVTRHNVTQVSSRATQGHTLLTGIWVQTFPLRWDLAHLGAQDRRCWWRSDMRWWRPDRSTAGAPRSTPIAIPSPDRTGHRSHRGAPLPCVTGRGGTQRNTVCAPPQHHIGGRLGWVANFRSE
jgi:hypothetical protein